MIERFFCIVEAKSGATYVAPIQEETLGMLGMIVMDVREEDMWIWNAPTLAVAGS